jgi:FixJ family two-component response regulator
VFLNNPEKFIWITRGFPVNVSDRKIAVIDDDLRVLESLVNLLASFGYEAESYKSAEEFLSSGDLSQISCIVTDVEMRQMSGLGLLQYLKNNNYAVPVIIITGKPSARSEAFYLASGAVGFFRKPVDGDALVDLIDSVCI